MSTEEVKGEFLAYIANAYSGEEHTGLWREAEKAVAEIDRLTRFARAEFERGFQEGEAKQAILEIQGRERFLAELKKKGGGK